MQQASWSDARNMLSAGQNQEMSRQNQSGGVRSQDDAMVGYFFQRPQTDMAQQYNSKRWAVGDDSVIEQVRSVNDLERDFQHMGFGESREVSKKIWEDEKGGGDAGKGLSFAAGGSPWTPREDSWSTNPSEHAVSRPLPMLQRRTGSLPGSQPVSLVSRSPETGALGVNMAEYVLGGSPVGKDMDARLHAMKRFHPPMPAVHGRVPANHYHRGAGGDGENVKQGDKSVKAPSPYEGEVKGDSDVNKEVGVQPNGIIPNGIEDDKAFSRTPGSRQNSPTEGDQPVGQQALPDGPKLSAVKPDPLLHHSHGHGHHSHGHGHGHGHHHIHGHGGEVPQQALTQPGLHLDHRGLQLEPQFEPVGIDPFPQVDYTSQLAPPSMDSPNFNVDYNQQLLQRQQPIAVLTQQQYSVAAQQQQLGLAAATLAPAGPYGLQAGQDQAAYPVAGIPLAGPAVVPHFYNVQTPYGIYPAAGLLQQQGGQQQLLRTQNGRPMTPQGSEGLSTPTGSLPQAQMGNPGTPQYQILAPAYYDQNGQIVMGNGRGMGTPVRLVSPAAPILVNAGQQGYTPTSSLYTPVSMSSSIFTPMSGSGLGLGPGGQGAGGPYSNGTLGGSGTPGAIGSGITQRRDSLGGMDYKQRPLPPLNQYYSTLGASSTSPAGPMGLVQPGQSLTPPPSLSISGSNSNLSLDMYSPSGLSSSGLYSAAPGAEAKFQQRNGAFGGASGLFGPSIFNPRVLAKSASLSKEVTGRSRLLEDFRNNRIPNLQLKDLVNHVVEFSQDQHGSRFIQQKLERATPAEKAMVFNEILTAAYSLMTDVFGNYVIQKFFEFGTPEQKQTLAQRVRGHVLPLALQMYGCRVIQKALESIPQEMQVEIVKELDGHVLKCVKDQNGNHVVQKCIECVDPPNLQFIIDAFKGQVFTLSTHPYGCRVIQRILEHCASEQTTPILDELHSQTERLVQDQYGNYVIQHVLEHGRPEDKSKIVSELRGKVLVLSQHKFASNVVEKCVSHSARAERAMLIEEVCTMNDGALYTMMKDQFANYVVQKMIDVSDPPQRKMLIHKIRPHVTTLRKYTYGKHILAKLEKFYMKNNAELGPIGMPPNGLP